jgi:protein TonB
MEQKKSNKADLEKKRGLFLEIGFVLALLFVFGAFEWTKEDVNYSSLGELADLTGEEEIIPITRQELEKPPEPPKPQQVVLELNIVEDDVVLEDDFIIEDFEASQDQDIQMLFAEEEEEAEPDFFVLVEDMPVFQGGGTEQFRNYIQSRIEYPKIAMENGVSGTVYVSFIVDKKGNYSEISILRSVDTSLDNAVLEAISKAPKWTPGMQRGKPVNVKMSIPVKFILN